MNRRASSSSSSSQQQHAHLARALQFHGGREAPPPLRVAFTIQIKYTRAASESAVLRTEIIDRYLDLNLQLHGEKVLVLGCRPQARRTIGNEIGREEGASGFHVTVNGSVGTQRH
jgi:hypothetical protein